MRFFSHTYLSFKIKYMKKIIIFILLIVIIPISNAENKYYYPYEKYSINNWNLLELNEVYKSNRLVENRHKRILEINSVNIEINFLEKSKVKKYIEKPLYNRIKAKLKELWYTWYIFDYANAKKLWKLEYNFHNKQEYSITNNSEEKQTFIVKFYPIRPFISPYPLRYTCLNKTKKIIINEDYWIDNIKLSLKNIWNIKFTKKLLLHKNLNDWENYLWQRCDKGKINSYGIYTYYEGKIEIKPLTTEKIIFSYNSLNFFSSSYKHIKDEFYLKSAWFWYLSPQEPTWITLSFKLNIPNNYYLYLKKDWKITNKRIFNSLRNKSFLIVKKNNSF